MTLDAVVYTIMVLISFVLSKCLIYCRYMMFSLTLIFNYKYRNHCAQRQGPTMRDCISFSGRVRVRVYHRMTICITFLQRSVLMCYFLYLSKNAWQWLDKSRESKRLQSHPLENPWNAGNICWHSVRTKWGSAAVFSRFLVLKRR